MLSATPSVRHTSGPCQDSVPGWPPPPIVPAPTAPPTIPPQPPTVFLPARWEYRHLARPVSETGGLTESELNELGREGWELVGLLPAGDAVHFYFKREIP